jgi:hypothetical protein
MFKNTSNLPVVQPKETTKGKGKISELEGGEVILSPSKILSIINGEKHENGGVVTAVAPGTMMFSQKILFPKEIVASLLGKDVSKVKKMSPAEIAKKFPTEQYVDTLKESEDPRAQSTAELMLNKNLGQLKNIFDAQEEFKASKGVKPGILLKDQGLDKNLEPINQAGGQFSGIREYMADTDYPLRQSGGQVVNDEDLRRRPRYQVGSNGYNNISQSEMNAEVGPFVEFDEETKKRILENYRLTGMTPPASLGFNSPTVKQVDGELAKSHPFVTSGLIDVPAGYNPKSKTWEKYSDMPKIRAIQKQLGLDDQGIYDTIKDYQTKWVTGTDEFAKNRRVQAYLHNTKDVNNTWRHQNYKPIYDANGELVDAEIKNYADGMNYHAQIRDKANVRNLQPVTPLLEQQGLTKKPVISQAPVKPPVIPKIEAQAPNKVYEGIDLQVPRELESAKLSEYANLFTNQKAVPYLRNDTVVPAYQRYIPMNTLSQERGQNFLNNTYNNSDASSQMTQAALGDNYAKTIQGIDEVQLRNYQAALANDNQNNQMFANAFNQNELSKNTNMADWVGRTQVVNDQFDAEQEESLNRIKNYRLQQARNSDNLSMRRLDALLSNDKFAPIRRADGKYSIEMNPNASRLYSQAEDSILMNQQDSGMSQWMQSMRNAGLTDEQIREVLKHKKGI